MEKVKIYCDGGCRGNQKTENIGAWGAVLILGDYQKSVWTRSEMTCC